MCVASSKALKACIDTGMREMGIRVDLEGELLGVDYAAGGRLRQRRVQTKRRKKGNQRLGKLRWLLRHRGRANDVARDGVGAEMRYGDEINGINHTMLRDIRRVHAAASPVKVACAPATAKLAIGGEAYKEFDPAVLRANPPLATLLAKLWDQPRVRSDFIRTWRMAGDEVATFTGNSTWGRV